MAPRAVQSDEDTAGARGRARAQALFSRRVSRVAQPIQVGEPCLRAIPGEVSAAQRMEGDGVQHVLCRDVQCLASRVGAAFRLASPRVLPESWVVSAWSSSRFTRT